MNQNISNYISAMKKQNHNIYDLSQILYKFVIALFIVIWVLLFFDVQIHYFASLTQIFIWAAGLIFVPFIALIGRRVKNNIIPYSRKDKFEFLGLYDLKDSNIDKGHDILSRDEEIKYMHQILEETIFPQTSMKQALCITGPSGSGKSIILNFFKRAYKDEYEIFDFSGNYHEFYGRMIFLLGSNIDQRISAITSTGKAVFILDQFERFFFLSKPEQARIQEIMRYLCRKNTGIIISLREEYLADFLKKFDMNNLLSAEEGSDHASHGIFRKLFSVIEKKNDMNSPALSLLRPTKTSIWESYTIKNNALVHLDTYGIGADRVILEKMGATLLYCRNQNEMNFQINGENSNASILESKCRILFGEDGSLLFNKHINEPLIEQQIIFHMAEFNQKILMYSNEELHKFIDKDSNELLGQYFDYQLASCSNYFHASRLLYLLSQARINQLSLKTEDLENYLFPNLFTKNGHEDMMNIIQQLETVQLIRKNTEGSSLEYEIAHDFIASSYLNYCSTNMDRNVKNALDLFMSEHMDDKRNSNTFFQEKISYRKSVYDQHFYRNSTCFTLALMFIAYFTQRFIFNPWTTIWSGLNPYGSYFPAFPLFITILGVVYFYYMIDRTVKYYRGDKVLWAKIVYIILLILAFMGVFAYPHFLFFDGLGVSFASFNIVTLLDQNYRQTCRNELRAYGSKSFMIGTVFACVHIFYMKNNPQFADFLILSEFIMFTILIAYGFVVHMTQEYIFARMADSASEKTVK
ncbi:MAG: ATP-binding protein [Synergistaceae bacterium]|nr:ATP-binding protein [Synergistaceae bacterium]